MEYSTIGTSPIRTDGRIPAEMGRWEISMAQTHQIDIKETDDDNGMGFVPASKSIAKGDTVIWTNQMDFDHTVTADNGSFDSKPIKPSKTFSRKFDAVGSFPYHCEIHKFMKGTITAT
jgi:plastocyanin